MRWILLQHAGLQLRDAFGLLSPLTIAVLVLAVSVAAQASRYQLDSTAGLWLHNVVAEPAVLQGNKGLRVAHSEEALRRLEGMTADQQAHFPQVATIDGLEFGDSVIEAEIAGAAPPGAPADDAFVGIAFRVQKDFGTFDVFYPRPTNGRVEDQVRRNRAVRWGESRSS